MMSLQKLKAIKKINEEYKDLHSNPIPNIGATIGLVNNDNIFEWKCSLLGPKDTSYAGGLFFLRVKFPENYPEKAPEVRFITPIYHVNINPKKPTNTGPGAESLGHVCLSTLNWWKNTYSMREVLINIFGLFYMGNPDSPYGMDRADEFRYNRPVYEEKIKYFTNKYAGAKNSEKEYDTDWDFSLG